MAISITDWKQYLLQFSDRFFFLVHWDKKKYLLDLIVNWTWPIGRVADCKQIDDPASIQTKLANCIASRGGFVIELWPADD